MATRDRVASTLREAPDGLDAQELGSRLGLHPNTVRWHLGALARAGLVSSAPVPRRGRGRPRVVYRAEPAGDDYRLLATVLSTTLGARPDGPAASERAGREWGRYLVPRRLPLARPNDEEACATVTALLAEHGFRPEAADGAIRMRSCPFHELGRARPEIVCAVHKGLIDGAFEELGSELRVEQLDPDTCVARLTRCPSGPSSPAAFASPA